MRAFFRHMSPFGPPWLPPFPLVVQYPFKSLKHINPILASACQLHCQWHLMMMTSAPPSQLPLPMASTSHIGTLALGMHTQVFTRHIKERHPHKDAPINNNTQVILAYALEPTFSICSDLHKIKQDLLLLINQFMRYFSQMIGFALL